MRKEFERAVRLLVPFAVMAAAAWLSALGEHKSGVMYGLSAGWLLAAIAFALGLSVVAPRAARLLCVFSYTMSLSLLMASVGTRSEGLSIVYLLPVIAMAVTAAKFDGLATLVFVCAAQLVVGFNTHQHAAVAVSSVGGTAAMGATFLVSVHSLRDRLHSVNAKLKEMALTDPLSGLPNRRGLDAWIERRCGASGFAMMAIDVDGLKELNDTHGHATGDELLRGVAAACRSALRSGDYIARVGGDEFVAFISGPSPAEAEELADRIRKAVDVVVIGDHRASVSIGIALGGPGDLPGDVLAQADSRMYEAKRGARREAAV